MRRISSLLLIRLLVGLVVWPRSSSTMPLTIQTIFAMWFHVVGASGAISGILGAYLLLYPKAKVRLLVWFGIVTILRVKASIVLIFWFAYQFLSVLKSTSQGGGVAWWAHIGGFIAGILVIFLFRKKNKSNLVEKGPWE